MRRRPTFYFIAAGRTEGSSTRSFSDWNRSCFAPLQTRAYATELSLRWDDVFQYGFGFWESGFWLGHAKQPFSHTERPAVQLLPSIRRSDGCVLRRKRTRDHAAELAMNCRRSIRDPLRF
jgi:hypothetical protein